MQKDTSPLVPLHYFGFGYAALVATGGFIGYAKAGSVPSLAAGLLFGSLTALGVYQLSQETRNVWVFLATSGTLAGIMEMQFYNSGKFMPAGLIAGASLLMVAKLGISLLSTPHPYVTCQLGPKKKGKSADFPYFHCIKRKMGGPDIFTHHTYKSKTTKMTLNLVEVK
uniref:transmembrane protein 14C-like n=1 Tax=Jaculus jaculus TaxID=51337 RepID=UPI001E1B0072|nr:transmembrane protein 14C-like [Jaculus jaculus]